MLLKFRGKLLQLLHRKGGQFGCGRFRPIEYTLEDYAVVFSSRQGLAPAMPAFAHLPRSVRTFKVDTNAFVAGLESAFGIKVEDTAKIRGEARSRKIQAALKELLSELGIAMEPNKAVFYNELTGVVMVRASDSDLEVVRAAIETLGGNADSAAAGPGVPGGEGRFGGIR